MTLLALDIATKTGWATHYASGVWDFATKRDESSGMKLIRFRSKIKELHESDHIGIMVWEKPAGRFKSSIIHVAKLIGIAEEFCIENGIEYREYSATEIKKHATGKGNANKDKMISSAQQKWPDIIVIDDNHADALWLYDLAIKDLKL